MFVPKSSPIYSRRQKKIVKLNYSRIYKLLLFLLIFQFHEKIINYNLFFKVTEQNQHLEEAVSHMEEGMKQFKLYEDTPSSVPELYLEILNLQLEMPDMARLEKPAKPPVPQVSLIIYNVYHSLEIQDVSSN